MYRIFWFIFVFMVPYSAWAAPDLLATSHKSAIQSTARSWVTRSNLVDVDEGALDSTHLHINLGDETLTARIHRSIRMNSPLGRSTSYSGRLIRVGDAQAGTFVVTETNGTTYGIFNLRGGLSFVLTKAPGSGSHWLDQIDSSSLPPCGNDFSNAANLLGSSAGSSATPSVPSYPQSSADQLGTLSTTTIDVMVMYSPEARAAEGGTSAMTSLINTAVTLANQAYTNSSINQQLHLVYSGETAQGELSTFDDMLSALYTPNDGIYDEVPTLRNTYGADLVSYLVNNTTYCGLGSLMSDFNPAFAEYAYNVVSFYCINNFSFAHELGHNMGANHDIANAGGSSIYPYAYGWAFQGNDSIWYRTIMAYQNRTPAETRINYFSNPGISYQGVATGSSGAADNAQTLNNTASSVAAFRTTSSVTPTPTPTLPPGTTATPTPTASPAATAVPTTKPGGGGVEPTPPRTKYLITLTKTLADDGTYTLSGVVLNLDSTPAEVTVELLWQRPKNKKKRKSYNYRTLAEAVSDTSGAVTFTGLTKVGNYKLRVTNGSNVVKIKKL